MTTNTFNHAQYLHRTLMTAKDELETHLRASLQDYIDFLPERGSLWVPEKYTSASDYKFITTDGSHFVFETEEFYSYGDNVRDCVELPFGFIEDPEEFKSATLQAIRDAETKKNKEAAQARVDNLRRQLEAAERALEEETK
jgi:hypothetical protein